MNKLKRFKNFVNENLTDTESEGKWREKNHTAMELKPLAMKLGFPNMNRDAYKTGKLEWSKVGGHGGDKTVAKVKSKALELGWKKGSEINTTHPANGNVKNGENLVDPTGTWELEATSRYGSEASYNRYSLTLKRIGKNESKMNEGHDYNQRWTKAQDSEEAAKAEVQRIIDFNRDGDDYQQIGNMRIMWVGETTDEQMDKLASRYEDQKIILGILDGKYTYVWQNRS